MGLLETSVDAYLGSLIEQVTNQMALDHRFAPGVFVLP